MKKFKVTVAIEEYQNYEIEAESKDKAREIWEEEGSSLDVSCYNYGDQIGETIIEEA